MHTWAREKSVTTEKMHSCANDFVTGWRAAMDQVKREWDAELAVGEAKKRSDEARKEAERRGM